MTMKDNVVRYSRLDLTYIVIHLTNNAQFVDISIADVQMLASYGKCNGMVVTLASSSPHLPLPN